jgi:drug/metabolite transporter (DMT)-like permease
LQREDLPWLRLVVLSGGIIGPALMIGLAKTSASSPALLLNVKGLATMSIAWFVFKENIDRRFDASMTRIIDERCRLVATDPVGRIAR